MVRRCSAIQSLAAFLGMLMIGKNVKDNLLACNLINDQPLDLLPPLKFSTTERGSRLCNVDLL